MLYAAAIEGEGARDEDPTPGSPSAVCNLGQTEAEYHFDTLLFTLRAKSGV